MQALLNDPETIPFSKKNKICLGLLKKDIDRRISKIRTMLGYVPPQKIQKNDRVTNSCQTDEQELTEGVLSIATQPEIMSSNCLVIHQFSGKNVKKYQKRCSLPVSKINHRHQDSR
jgi:hypothetical protein